MSNDPATRTRAGAGPARAQPRGEIPLPGGTANRGLVVRLGDTVRRPMRATSAATHALLRHLEEVGFDGAPRYLGTDELGREVLTYLRGEAPIPPYRAWALTDDALASVALLMRRFHDAARLFPADHWPWHRQVPDAFRSARVSHNDINLDNVVFRDGRAVGLIDFDLAGAGSTVWDLAMAARLWCPLRDERDITDARHGRALQRVAILLDEYGATSADRRLFAAAVLSSHQWAYDHVRQEVANGHAAFTEHWLANNAHQRAERTSHWLTAHRGDLARAAGA